MTFNGSVNEYLESRRSSGMKQLIVLLDPDYFSPMDAGDVAKAAQAAGASAVMVGGSTVYGEEQVELICENVMKHVTIPVILFPNNITGVSRKANAILFMSLVNSLNHYYIYGAQALAAPKVMTYKLEVLPTAYMIVGGQSSAAFVGYAFPFPSDKPELASMYALSSWYLGMRYLYLEAGSGAKAPISPRFVSIVRNVYPGFLIVGGGIDDSNTAFELAKAGADALVVGNLMQTQKYQKVLSQIVKSLRSVSKH